MSLEHADWHEQALLGQRGVGEPRRNRLRLNDTQRWEKRQIAIILGAGRSPLDFAKQIYREPACRRSVQLLPTNAQAGTRPAIAFELTGRKFSRELVVKLVC